MASRLFAAAAAASSPLPLARRITSRGLPGPQGRSWYSEKVNLWEEDYRRRWEKVNLWEDPRSPKRWKSSNFVAATVTVWGVLVFGWFKFFDGEKNEKTKVSTAKAKAR